MRKISLLCCTFLVVIICNGQFETGQKLIGGQLGFSFSSNYPNGTSATDKSNYSNVYTSLSLSHFKSPTLLTGGGFTYSHNYQHYNIGNTFTEEVDYAHSFNFFLSRTRLIPLAKKLYLGYTGTANMGYGFGKNSIPGGPTTTNTKSYNIGLTGGLGMFYQVKQRLLLNASLSNLLNIGFTRTDYHYNSSVGIIQTIKNWSGNNFSVASGLDGFSFYNLTIGIRYMLKK